MFRWVQQRIQYWGRDAEEVLDCILKTSEIDVSGDFDN